MFLTKQGLEKYKNELSELQTVLPSLIKETGAMAALGDRSENAGYINAKANMRKTQARIRYLEDLIKHSKLIESKKSDFVEIGSTVTLLNLSNDEIVTYKIVDSIEADPSKNLISFHSPLGKLLINKSKDNSVFLQTSFYTTEYKILSLN